MFNAVMQKRFQFPENGVEIYAKTVNKRGVCHRLRQPLVPAVEKAMIESYSLQIILIPPPLIIPGVSFLHSSF